MKEAVVFYSKDGSTRVAAEVMGEKFGADVFELEPKRAYGRGFGGFMRGGFGAAFGTKCPLKDTFADKMQGYDKIYIGTPLWASKAAPPVNAFIAYLDADGKEIVLFSLQADPTQGEPTSGMTALAEKLKKQGATVSSVVRLYGAGVGKTVQKADMSKRIEEKM